MKTLKRITMFGACLGLMTGAAVASEVPDYVKINSIKAAGSGCPLGSVAQNISTDKTAFTLTFSEYLAEAFPGSFPADARRNCNITVDLDFPEGWTYSVVSFDYRGFVALDRGMEATAQASYYFQSDANEVKFQSKLRGEIYDNYHFRDTVALDSVVWSPGCKGAKRPLNLKTDVRVSNNGNRWGEGMITVDSIDSQFTQKYSLVWSRCDNGQNDDAGNNDWDFRPDYDDRFPDAPQNVSIRTMTYNGTGCPIGSIANTISSDRRAFTLLFDSFVAEAGPGLTLRDSRKNCQLTVSLDYPDDWTFALATFDYRGYAFLDQGVQGTQTANYYFQGQANGFQRSKQSSGYTDGDFHFRDVVPLDALAWAPCGAKRALNINSSIQVNNRANPTGEGLMTIDSVDGQVGAYHGLVWRRCR